jgi:hypothetical protein
MASLRGKSGKSSDAATAASCAAVQPRVCIATTTAPQPFSLRPPHSHALTSRLAAAGGSAAGPTEAPHGRSSRGGWRIAWHGIRRRCLLCAPVWCETHARFGNASGADGPEIRPGARARRVQDAELVGLDDQERRRRNPALLDERRQLRHLIAAQCSDTAVNACARVSGCACIHAGRVRVRACVSVRASVSVRERWREWLQGCAQGARVHKCARASLR